MSSNDIREICDMLQDRVEDLAPILLPEGKRVSRDWRAGGQGGRSIGLHGQYRGIYTDFRSGQKGMDMLDAIAEILCGGSKSDALKWAKSFLGIEGMTDDALRLAKRKAADRRVVQEQEAAALNIKRRKQANGIWFGAKPIKDTPGHGYFTGRGIDLSELSKFPSAIRYSDKVWCKDRRGEYPAIVTALWRIGESKLTAVHRTFLDLSTDPPSKAKIQNVRTVLGPWPETFIPIQRGETDVRWSQIEEGAQVALGEGIEEALSIALVQPDWRVAAVGFVGNFGQIKLPHPCKIQLCVNNDPEFDDQGRPHPATVAIDEAVTALRGRGHYVSVCRPPSEYKDWNDFINGIPKDG